MRTLKQAMSTTLFALLTLTSAAPALTANAQGNTPPAPGFTINPQSGDTNTLFTFDGSISTDLEDGTGPASPLQVRFDFDGDGNFDTNFSTNKVATHTYPLPNTYSVIMEVRDTDGNVSNLGKFLTVTQAPAGGGNTPPAPGFTINPPTADVNTLFTFDGSISTDLEDGTGPASPLQVRFDFEGDGTFDTVFSANKVSAHRYATPGTKTIIMEVQDTDGNIVNLGKNLNVLPAGSGLNGFQRRRKSKRRPNKAPVAVLTTSASVATAGDTVTLDASKSSDDRQNHWLLFKFDFDGDGQFDTDFTHKRVAEVKYKKTGMMKPMVVVRDMNGFESKAEVAVEVNEPVKVVQPEVKSPSRRLNTFFYQHKQFNDMQPEPTTMKQLQFESKISNELVEGSRTLTRTLILRNTSDLPMRNIKVVELQTDPTNGGRLMINVPNYKGSNFFPVVKYGNLHNGYLMIEEVPAGGVLYINHHLVASTLTVPAGEESKIALLSLLVNTGERVIDTITLKNATPRLPLEEAAEMLPTALMAGAVLATRRRLTTED